MYHAMFRKIAKRPLLRQQLEQQKSIAAAFNPAFKPYALTSALDPTPTVDWTNLDWKPATFFDGPPTPTTRAWYRLVRPLPGPSQPWGVPKQYEAILYTFGGAHQRHVVVFVTGAGATLRAALPPGS